MQYSIYCNLCTRTLARLQKYYTHDKTPLLVSREDDSQEEDTSCRDEKRYFTFDTVAMIQLPANMNLAITIGHSNVYTLRPLFLSWRIDMNGNLEPTTIMQIALVRKTSS